PGRPMDDRSQAFFGSRLRMDFSHVRVHTDEKAAQSAEALNARAYAFGHHIVFAGGEYSPRSSQGGHLLAHELAHVVQQSTTDAGSFRIQRKPNDKPKQAPGKEKTARK